MHSALSSPMSHDDQPLQARWQQYFAQWRESLSECADKPTRKHIHAVRSLTLRLRVTLEFCLHQHPMDAERASVLKRWKKESKKLRRLMAPIRNADVFLARLGELNRRQKRAGQEAAELNAASQRELQKLARRLKQERQKAIIELVKLLDERLKKLKRLSVTLEDLLVSQAAKLTCCGSEEALRRLSCLAESVPSLDSSNLHIFRKGLKESLYLAELAADYDGAGTKLAVSLRKMHVATGDWHDCHALAEEARRILPSHDEETGVVPLLEKLSEEGLGRAIEVCRHTTAQLLKMELDDRRFPTRKPVDSVAVKSKSSKEDFLRLA